MPTITTQYAGDMLFETQLGQHKLQVDVPEPMGGKDRGPQPPQLFIASLGTCVAALVANYCNHHHLDATGLKVDVSFDKADKPTRLVNIAVKVELPKVDCHEERVKQVLEQVAEHCPVHETMATLDAVNFEIRGEGECSLA